ncbi:MAG: metal-dependent hydrolase [Gammaproteobacteria bacterium]|nr:metal-dependent hydrolase [Gammaproteobacteria bacterium]
MKNNIVLRAFSFDFPDDLNPKWNSNNPVFAHFFNGVSLTMPYLEPYLCRTNDEARKQIRDPELLHDIKQFNGQEYRHHECHKRLNVLLNKNGYPEFKEIEEKIRFSYQELSGRSLPVKLAYSAGFETMTQGFTKWLLGKRTKLFKNACPYISSFWLMHMIEEAEHKTVAFDVYMACSGSYLTRALGVFHGSFHVLGYSFAGMLTAMKKDKLLWTLKGQIGIASLIGSIIWNIGPYFLNALLPWHDPRNSKEPEWFSQWIKAYPASDPLKQPLVDTSDPVMPIPF